MSGSGSPLKRGRHRRPSTTGKTLARTVVAGAVVGTPLVTAGTAQAASDNVWDRVAQCESGGNWAINTGNGFQGGLQFTQSTWRSFGGGAFASSANRASRGEQIAVAEKVLAGQGWGAWPVCSRKAHATGQPATPRVISARSVGTKSTKQHTSVPRSTGRHVLRPTTGTPLTHRPTSVTAAPEAEHAVPVVQVADRLQPLVGSASPAVAAPLTALPLAQPTPAAPVGPAGAPAVTVPSGRPAPAHPAPAAAPAPVLASAPAPAHPAPVIAPAHPAPAPVIAPAPRAATTVPVADSSTSPHTYQVHQGDTLSSIARAQAVPGGWQAIYSANRGAVGNANLIRPGQQLTLS